MLLNEMLVQFENIGAAEKLGPVSSMMLISLWRKSSKINNPSSFGVSYRDLTFLSGIVKPNEFTQALNRLAFFGYIKYKYDKIEFIEIELNLNLYEPFERIQVENSTHYKSVMDALETHYILLRGQGFFPSAIDFSEMRDIAENTTITVDQAVQWLNECFEQYTPRHEKDSIRSFKYCASYIRNRLSIENAKNGKGEITYGINSRSNGENSNTKTHSRKVDAITARRNELFESGFFENMGDIKSDF